MVPVYANSYLLHVHWGVLVSVFTAEDAVWFVCVVYVAPLTLHRCAYLFLQQEMQGGVCGLCSTFNSAQVCVSVFTAGDAAWFLCVVYVAPLTVRRCVCILFLQQEMQRHLCVLFNTFNNV